MVTACNPLKPRTKMKVIDWVCPEAERKINSKKIESKKIESKKIESKKIESKKIESKILSVSSTRALARPPPAVSVSSTRALARPPPAVSVSPKLCRSEVYFSLSDTREKN